MEWEATPAMDSKEAIEAGLREAGECLRRTAASLLALSQSRELWHLGFAKPRPRKPPLAAAKVSGLHLAPRLAPHLDPFAVLAQARNIFQDLAPGEPFLVQDEEDLAAQAAMRGEAEDEDQAMLEAALTTAASLDQKALEDLNQRIASLEQKEGDMARRIGALERKGRALGWVV
mmetsp:Transcript_23488/g.68640  ORF Transcript_23488/g.68640 Transcript_23488/m.68640 type:complete len:174 (+) Transcript_23488:1440-1961(+)